VAFAAGANRDGARTRERCCRVGARAKGGTNVEQHRIIPHQELIMENQNKPAAPAPTTPSNNHVSAEDLKKIRGGIASPGAPTLRSVVEKSDEDHPRPVG
jgi:hypothetical protein